MKSAISLMITSLLAILLLALPPAIADETTPANLYLVKAGDTLPSIAKQYDISTSDLTLMNGLQSSALLEGQKLWVPIIHTVSEGETIANIAVAYHSTANLIKKHNNLSSDSLATGQQIKIIPKQFSMQGQHILMSREEFKDWLLNGQFTREIHLIQQHHTWQPSYKHFHGTNHFPLLESMQNHHINKMGWGNIAQNITTFPDGKIAVSRPFDSAPEGSIGPKANKHGIAIENVGNFDVGHDKMTKEQRETIIYVTALLSLKFGLTPSIDSITYHHWWHYKTKERVLDHAEDYEVKSCPGTGFFGGNATESARKYFYPFIKAKMEEIQNNMN
ncbi:LysM peptidoglycan-binding domain-containing protein [Ornithinibacillus xuwenensis]|uniref:Autolysin n=1 Tax=Ornithinibacillus xuwenensis TaxID=3144668 RepID=A0ABU9XF59_9BACI